MLYGLGFLVLALQADALTSRNTPGRTSVNAAETTPTPAEVNAATVGKLWTLYADGQIVAQPLYVARLLVATSAHVAQWVRTMWADTQLHDYTGHVEDERTSAEGWVELWLPPQGYVMMALP